MRLYSHVAEAGVGYKAPKTLPPVPKEGLRVFPSLERGIQRHVLGTRYRLLILLLLQRPWGRGVSDANFPGGSLVFNTVCREHADYLSLFREERGAV